MLNKTNNKQTNRLLLNYLSEESTFHKLIQNTFN
jgi:hypothetical protein